MRTFPYLEKIRSTSEKVTAQCLNNASSSGDNFTFFQDFSNFNNFCVPWITSEHRFKICMKFLSSQTLQRTFYSRHHTQTFGQAKALCFQFFMAKQIEEKFVLMYAKSVLICASTNNCWAFAIDTAFSLSNESTTDLTSSK